MSKWVCWNCNCDDLRERVVINMNTGKQIQRDVFDDFWCNECGENDAIGEVLYEEKSI